MPDGLQLGHLRHQQLILAQRVLLQIDRFVRQRRKRLAPAALVFKDDGLRHPSSTCSLTGLIKKAGSGLQIALNVTRSPRLSSAHE